MALSRVFYIKILTTLALSLPLAIMAQGGSELPWYYSLPSTEEGKQKKEQIELYRSRGDFRNTKMVSRFSRRIEPGCFYFVENEVMAAYNMRDGDEVIALSDSMMRSELATEETFKYNAFLHDWRKDRKGALRSIDRGLEMFPEDRTLLHTGMRLALDGQDLSRANQYGETLLLKYPNDWQTYYDYQKFYTGVEAHDYAIVMGDLALIVGSSSPKNVEIKNLLVQSYNAWLREGRPSQKFASLAALPQNLTEIRNMQNLLFLQGFMTYNYGRQPGTNFLEDRLYRYKFEVIEKCNWIAYYYERFGLSLFPTDYDKYLEQNMEKISGLNNCLSNIATLN